MKVVAEREDGVFLVSTRGEIGCVVDLEDAIVFEEHRLQSILARGYWEEVTDRQGAKRALALVKKKSS
jgi:hypothetical protein